MTNRKPFGQIQELPELSTQFVEQYGSLLNQEADEMRPIVDDDLKKVLNTLDEKEFAAVFRNKFIKAYEDLKEKLEGSSEIAAVKNIRLESDTLKLRCLDEITDYEMKHQPQPEPEPSVTPVTPVGGGEDTKPAKPVTPPVQPKPKKRKNVSISNVAGARTYSIENEQDIDKFLTEMKKKLLQELEENTIITLS